MHPKLLRALAALSSLALAAACTEDPPNSSSGGGGEGGNAGSGGMGGSGLTTTTGGNGGTGGDAGGGGTPECAFNGFTSVEQIVGYYTAQDSTYYEASNAANFPRDALTLELYYQAGAMTGAQQLTFTGENYATCAVCSLIYEDCTDPVNCDRVFLASEGTLDITANGINANDAFTGTIGNAKFVEVTIDPSTLQSTPVPNGEVWCVQSLPFNALVAVDP